MAKLSPVHRPTSKPSDDAIEAVFQLSMADPVVGAVADAVGYEYLLKRYLGEAVADPFLMARLCDRLHRRRREAKRASASAAA